ncbi:MAG: glycoside hydrolase family 15 protein [Mycobacteriales bacterium]
MAERIEDYALIGDAQTAALVGRSGSIDWLCLPRFDSEAVFAALLGDENNGHWDLAPASGGRCTRRSYRGPTLILDSEWETPEGTVRVSDFMPPRGEAPDVVRIVEGLSGRVAMRGELRLRFGYGRVVPWVRRENHGLVAVAGPDLVTLRTPAPLEGRNFSTVSEFEVSAGERVPFVLTWRASHLGLPKPVDAEAALDQTEAFWAQWMADCHYDGEWSEAVERSLVTLKALTYAPTGGIVAAATTSLPEALGGPRNWDYRYCWLRDTTMTLQALLYTGFVEEAKAWREWLLRAIAGDPADLQIMYGLAGERYLAEREIPWLAGYEGSRPVRVGNAASDQFQLDVYGEVLDGMYTARQAGLPVSRNAWNIQRALLDFLESNWQHQDQGLWEIRGPARHFVHSKVLAWAGVDRAVRTVEQHPLPGPVERWKELRQNIFDDVCRNGFDVEKNSFVQYYGAKTLDASLLLIPQVGFLPPDDRRVIGTVEAVARELYVDGFVLRYDPSSGVDGLPGREGAFLACSFWLADALDMIGRTAEARELFERLLSLRNDVGLLAEEYDHEAGRQVGNTPQAFSHVPLVNTARQMSGHGSGSGRTHRIDPPHHEAHRRSGAARRRANHSR